MGARLRLTGWRPELKTAVARARAGAEGALALLRTHRVVLAGPPNAGKSTLANRLLRGEHSIVSPVPGTTRDRLERPAELRGLAVLLSDTAGVGAVPLDAPGAPLAHEGQARARDAVLAADLALYLVDASRPPSPEEREEAAQLLQRLSADVPRRPGRPAPPRLLLVLNKSDLGVHPEAQGWSSALGVPALTVSALHGDGLDALEDAIEGALLRSAPPKPGAPFTLRQRHCLEALAAGLEEALDAVELIGHIRALVGTRPNEEQLAAVLREAAEGEE
jgi:tRNA modification GTPase